jgi:hypothetical protein
LKAQNFISQKWSQSTFLNLITEKKTCRNGIIIKSMNLFLEWIGINCFISRGLNLHQVLNAKQVSQTMKIGWILVYYYFIEIFLYFNCKYKLVWYEKELSKPNKRRHSWFNDLLIWNQFYSLSRGSFVQQFLRKM